MLYGAIDVNSLFCRDIAYYVQPYSPMIYCMKPGSARILYLEFDCSSCTPSVVL